MYTGVYRVLTFQSKEVVDIVSSGNVYYASDMRLRERSSLDLRDVEAVGGFTPIWVFTHPTITNAYTDAKRFTDLIEMCRCEMSLPERGLDGMYMLELQVAELPPKGIGHNSNSCARVIRSIEPWMVLAIYEISTTYSANDDSVEFNDNFYRFKRILEQQNMITLLPEEHTYTMEEYIECKHSVKPVHLVEYNSAIDYVSSTKGITIYSGNMRELAHTLLKLIACCNTEEELEYRKDLIQSRWFFWTGDYKSFDEIIHTLSEQGLWYDCIHAHDGYNKTYCCQEKATPIFSKLN